jgi:hypothetical protein
MQVDLDIGPYRVCLPAAATVPASDERPRPSRSLPLARIGPIELHAVIADGTLEEWRNVVELATKCRTQFLAIAVNGIPGLKLPPNDRRLDYAFQSPGQKRIELMTWSDEPTTEEQRRTVEVVIHTLHVRPRASIILPE